MLLPAATSTLLGTLVWIPPMTDFLTLLNVMRNNKLWQFLNLLMVAL